ncbi:MAG TPA: molybdopterin biosynthesis protein MoeY [Pseudoduganella sp.]
MTTAPLSGDTSRIVAILEKAKWAPSGDNDQPWRFEIIDASRVRVHCADTSGHCVYDLEGWPSQIAMGAMFETMAIAATAHGLATAVQRCEGCSDKEPVFDVTFTAQPGMSPDPLISAIERRSVQRRPMSRRALSADEKQALEQAVGSGFTVQWLEGGARMDAARLMYNNARLRLLMPEAYTVHKRVIKWGKDTSAWGVPDQALGVDNMTLRLMKWAMVSWDRLKTMNTLMGTWAPRLQMDLVPGLACAAHFVLRARVQPRSVADYVAAGRAVQRFWLTLTQLGLVMQPEMTPLIFSSYVRNGREFTATGKLRQMAAGLAGQFDALLGQQAGTPVFMGRLGQGKQAAARSTRPELADLMHGTARTRAGHAPE